MQASNKPLRQRLELDTGHFKHVLAASASYKARQKQRKEKLHVFNEMWYESYGKGEDLLQYIMNIHNIFHKNISVKSILS